MEDDFTMGEAGDSVLPSTEVNGHVTQTVDPSVLALDGGDHDFPNRKLQPAVMDDFDQDHAQIDNTFQPLGHNASYESDDMDITYAVPQHRVEVRIPPAPRYPPLSYSSRRTGLVYDARMRFHCEPLNYLAGDDDIHPEDPRRIHEIFQEIQQAGLVRGPDEDGEDRDNDERCWRIHPRPATRGEICLVHTEDHYEFIKGLQEKSEDELRDLSEKEDSIYFNNSTYECARLAAGGAIEACRAVVRGDVRNAIAIIRPPGHHAECDKPSGFCIFNNVPIATRVCQNDFGNKCRKVMILDWDVHHGNGVQHAFYDDPNVLYISLHVFKNRLFYPGLPDGNLEFIGEGAGAGKNVNIPWHDCGMGDAEYIYAFQQVVLPIGTEFDPDLVIISAGFDAAEGDTLGGCHVTPACYAHMTHMLMSLAKGKLVVCLEGGYNLRSIARSALAVTRTLMLEPPERLVDDLGPPKAEAVRVIERVRRAHSKYWKCMLPKVPEGSGPAATETRRLHDIIREWQSNVLSREHHMIPLQIIKPEISNTFRHHVLATPRFMEARPLLLIFHDPPEVMNMPDPVSGGVDLHNIWLTDVTKSYIEWAIKEGFEVVDVNIPQIVHVDENDRGRLEADSLDARSHQTRILANYLWENYIEPFDATQIFLMGIGAAYHGLIELLGSNESTTSGENEIAAFIGFTCTNSIQSIKRTTDDYIGNWFHEHSLIFVSHEHAAWDPSRTRKLRKRYGRLVKSPKNTLPTMLEEHKAQVQQLLLEKKNEYEARRRAKEEEADLTDDTGEPEEAAFAKTHVRHVAGSKLKSPPASMAAPSTHASVQGSRAGSVHGNGNGNGHGHGPRATTPKMPQLGIFSVSSPRSPGPRSPMKRH